MKKQEQDLGENFSTFNTTLKEKLASWERRQNFPADALERRQEYEAEAIAYLQESEV